MDLILAAEGTEQAKSIAQRLDHIIWLLAVALVLVAPTHFSYALEQKDGPFILYADLFAAAIVGLWLLVTVAQRRLREVLRPPAAIWAVLAVALLSALGATSRISAAVEIAKLTLYFVAVYALFVNVFRGQHRLVIAAKAVAASGTVVILIALYQYVTADDPMDVRGTLTNRNYYGAYIVMVLPLLYGMAIWTRDSLHRSWFIGVVVLGAFTMLAGIQFWCLALVLLVMSALKSLRALGYYVAGATLVIVIIVAALPKNQHAIFTEVADPIERGAVFNVPVGEEPPTLVKKRWLEWHPALVMLSDNFLLGVGPGNYQLHIGEQTNWGYVPNFRKIEAGTNNLYLVIGGSIGFIGLVAFVAWIGRFWRLAERNWARAGDDWSMGICWGLLGSVYGIVLVNIFAELLVRGSSLLWALIFAMIASIAAHGFSERGLTEEEESLQDSRGEE